MRDVSRSGSDDPLSCASPPPVKVMPLCDSPSGCCSFTEPWTVTRPSLRMLRRVAAFCRPLRPVLLLVSFPRSRGPGQCWLWRDVPFVRERCVSASPLSQAPLNARPRDVPRAPGAVRQGDPQLPTPGPALRGQACGGVACFVARTSEKGGGAAGGLRETDDAGREYPGPAPGPRAHAVPCRVPRKA